MDLDIFIKKKKINTVTFNNTGDKSNCAPRLPLTTGLTLSHFVSAETDKVPVALMGRLY